MSEKTDSVKALAEMANQGKIDAAEFVASLEGSSRRSRQNAAAVLAQLAKINPEALSDHIDAFIDALNRPEAQTRWESLDVLTEMIPIDSRSCDKALDGAETALFDEENGFVRLAALRFLCRLGATTENRSQKSGLCSTRRSSAITATTSITICSLRLFNLRKEARR